MQTTSDMSLMNGFLPVPSFDTTTTPSSPQIVTSTDAEETLPKTSQESKWAQLLDRVFEDAKFMTLEQRHQQIYPYFMQFCANVDVDRFNESYLSNARVDGSSTKRNLSSIVEAAGMEDNSSSDVGSSPSKKKRKKKDKPKDDKKMKEWSEKIRQIADEGLPSLTDLQDIEQNFSEGKQKHIAINYRFITEKKENHSEQVRHTYKNFFDRYPKLFYFFSYWTLNGKFKIIKSVFDESPDLYKKCVTDIPDEYKKIWITQ